MGASKIPTTRAALALCLIISVNTINNPNPINPYNGLTAKILAPAVAKPIPPLNWAKIGQQCPKTAKPATKGITHSKGACLIASKVGK